jgi:ankyrin repeat protein
MSVNMVNAAGVGADGSTALMASCERGHKDIVEFLLSYGAGTPNPHPAVNHSHPIGLSDVSRLCTH